MGCGVAALLDDIQRAVVAPGEEINHARPQGAVGIGAIVERRVRPDARLGRERVPPAAVGDAVQARAGQHALDVVPVSIVDVRQRERQEPPREELLAEQHEHGVEPVRLCETVPTMSKSEAIAVTMASKFGMNTRPVTLANAVGVLEEWAACEGPSP